MKEDWRFLVFLVSLLCGLGAAVGEFTWAAYIGLICSGIAVYHVDLPKKFRKFYTALVPIEMLVLLTWSSFTPYVGIQLIAMIFVAKFWMEAREGNRVKKYQQYIKEHLPEQPMTAGEYIDQMEKELKADRGEVSSALRNVLWNNEMAVCKKS